MYDSTAAMDIPAGARLVAGYLDGSPDIQWSPTDWGRFPGARKLPIVTDPDHNEGLCLDVENGDATPAQAPAWVPKRRAAGVVPWVYADASNWGACRQAFAQQGVPEPKWWIALWDGIPNLATVPGAVAKQYQHPPLSGGHFDVSVVAEFVEGFDGMPGLLVTYENAVWVVDPLLTHRVWVRNPADLQGLQASGLYIACGLDAQQMSDIPVVGPSPADTAG